MFSARRLLAIVPVMFLVSASGAGAAENWSWDGVWKGMLGKSSAISITIKKDKVVTYAFRGAPIAVAYSKLTPDSVSFGDREHYNVTLKKTGEASAEAVYHGRLSDVSAALARQ